ncbi:MAG: hypothetical protein QM640_05105 [Niabella sp.]
MLATEQYENPAGYPPKYPLEETENKPSFVKNLYSIIIYLGIGYLLLRRWDLLLLIFGVVLLHEAGHLLAMKYYQYADVGIFFLPFIGAFVQGSKKEISQKQSAVILLAGPLPGILLGIILSFIDRHGNIYLGAMPLQLAAQMLIWGNLLNLLPVYPLDGGQLLNRVYFNEEGILSNIYFIISAIIIIWLSVSTQFYLLLIIPALFIYKYVASFNYIKLEKDMAQSGIDLNISYDQLKDEDYWQIRKILIRHLPVLQQIDPGPPYEYSPKEERVAQEVDHILQRNLLMDMPVAGKIILALVWGVAIALPWLLHIDFLLLKYFMR